MNKVNYAAMSDRQLKKYLLANRQDQSALQAYLDRRNKIARPIITQVGDPDFDSKIHVSICQQVNNRNEIDEN